MFYKFLFTVVPRFFLFTDLLHLGVDGLGHGVHYGEHHGGGSRVGDPHGQEHRREHEAQHQPSLARPNLTFIPVNTPHFDKENLTAKNLKLKQNIKM
jgi:hypothetical protein